MHHYLYVVQTLLSTLWVHAGFWVGITLPWPLVMSPETCHGGLSACAVDCLHLSQPAPYSWGWRSDHLVPTLCLSPPPVTHRKRCIIFSKSIDIHVALLLDESHFESCFEMVLGKLTIISCGMCDKIKQTLKIKKMQKEEAVQCFLRTVAYFWLEKICWIMDWAKSLHTRVCVCVSVCVTSSLVSLLSLSRGSCLICVAMAKAARSWLSARLMTLVIEGSIDPWQLVLMMVFRSHTASNSLGVMTTQRLLTANGGTFLCALISCCGLKSKMINLVLWLS